MVCITMSNGKITSESYRKQSTKISGLSGLRLDFCIVTSHYVSLLDFIDSGLRKRLLI